MEKPPTYTEYSLKFLTSVYAKNYEKSIDFKRKMLKNGINFLKIEKKNQKKSCPQILPPFYHDGGKCAQMCRRSVSPRLHGKNG